MSIPPYHNVEIGLTGCFRFRPSKLMGTPIVQVEVKTRRYQIRFSDEDTISIKWRDATFQEAIEIQMKYRCDQPTTF
ncbi:hypothetical protein [Xenorhabdus bharatensis]|uniref:hypothetical protein n=1 Tax=Xenorhabdus bharatensis TaxID=3136256 RepID=UPI0030F4363D